MDWMTTLTAALSDPFRVVLIIGLVITQRRTAGVTGRFIPLAAGTAFIAALLPMTVQQTSGADLIPAIGIGLVANVILLAVVLAGFALWDRFRT